MNKDEPEPPRERPAPPEEVMQLADAIAEWERVVPVLDDMGLLTKVDRAALSGYCICYARWLQAERELKTTGGLLVKTPNGYPVQNPLIGIANQQLKLMQGFLGEFGLSPAARTRVGAGGGGGGPGARLGRFASGRPKKP